MFNTPVQVSASPELSLHNPVKNQAKNQPKLTIALPKNTFFAHYCTFFVFFCQKKNISERLLNHLHCCTGPNDFSLLSIILSKCKSWCKSSASKCKSGASASDFSGLALGFFCLIPINYKKQCNSASENVSLEFSSIFSFLSNFYLKVKRHFYQQLTSTPVSLYPVNNKLFCLQFVGVSCSNNCAYNFHGSAHLFLLPIVYVYNEMINEKESFILTNLDPIFSLFPVNFLAGVLASEKNNPKSLLFIILSLVLLILSIRWDISYILLQGVV